MADQYKPRTPKLKCPDCDLAVLIRFPQGAYCPECETELKRERR